MRIDSPQDLQELMGTRFAPTEQQWAAITEGLEPVVVMAGAGSGKTTLMAARVVYLVATKTVGPDQILGLTFTNKAAAQLRDRVRGVLEESGLMPRPGQAHDETVLGPTVATYNSYAAALVRDHATRIGLEPDLRLIPSAAAAQLASAVVARHRGPVEELGGSRGSVVKQLLHLDGQLNEHLVAPEQVRSGQRRFLDAWLELRPGRRTATNVVDRAVTAALQRRELLGLVEEYRAAKRELGLIEFSDQIALASRIAEECPDVAEAERARFPVVLLDEFQDTSVAQARMLARLFSPEGGGHGVMGVGDPNQAIYGWRGASVSNIIHFADTFPRSDGARRDPLPLSVSMRSDREILDLANVLAQPLYAATSGTEPLTPRPAAGPGRVDAALYETDADEIEALPSLVRTAWSQETDGRWRDIGVLTRDNSTATRAYDALVAEGIPVEIVGLKGLLARPEVNAVVDVLRVLEDPTANSAALSLLSGPRWRIGPRDLRLLEQRARELAGGLPSRRRAPVEQQPTLDEHLDELARGSDPAELTALLDAVDDPGDRAYSPEARDRLRQLSEELLLLRRHAGDPVPDLVRRIVAVTGLDVELAAAGSSARRENLDAFVAVVGEFRSYDGASDLSALLAYLAQESESGQGMDQQTPSRIDAVQLLTVHRAKGLEFTAVFVLGLTDTVFPSARSSALWTRDPSELPHLLRGDAADLAALQGYDAEAIAAFHEDAKDHDLTEERRLGYVAFTRAARLLVLSGCWWRKENVNPNGPSSFLELARRFVTDQGREPLVWWPAPEEGASNPSVGAAEAVHWPVEEDPAEAERRRAGAALVRAALGSDQPVVECADPRIAIWDTEIDRLVAEQERLATAEVEVPWPGSLSATGVMAYHRDPEEFLVSTVRPMPRRPSRAARFGTRFHEWIEQQLDPQGSQPLVDLTEVPGREDADVRDEAELGALAEAFLASPFGQRADGQVEVPFALALAGQTVRGRIDAVFPDGDGWLVVDWKTNRSHDADPIQLAIYREAWADIQGVPADRVRSAFYYVRDGALVEPPDLPSRAWLESLLGGG